MSGSFDPYHRWLGIPADQQPPDHYRLLGIAAFEADLEVIANAADQRMGHLRQFQAGSHGELSQRLLNEVAAARVCLLKANAKAVYDASLKQRLAADDARLAGPPPPPLPPVETVSPDPVHAMPPAQSVWP